MSFIIAVDSSCDLPLGYIEQEHLYVFSLIFNLGGQEHLDDLGQTYTSEAFYNAIRNGAMPTTSQVNTYTFKKQFIEWAKSNTPVLYIAFSSGLSGTYNSALAAREEVLEAYPDAQIQIVDTRAASSGMGLLVYHACLLRAQGQSIDAIRTYIEETRDYLCHLFTVNDLHHLERGGRISHTSAFVGSLLQIKPVLYVNNEGKLIPYQKAHGRKKALHALVTHLESLITLNPQPIMISHSDCIQDANYVAQLLQEKLDLSPVMINNIGPVIGSHCGADVVALFFIGKQKTPLHSS
ncbi:MAG: DegV family protein [Candidatus Niameybacter stercoravium]|nr:DegV family protein [Candidatus Niameybacter stercoravium]